MRRVRFLAMPTYRSACCLTVAILFTTACSDSSGPKPGGPRIRLISGYNVTDTALALLKAALVVEVRDSSGAVAPQGTLVRFTTVMKYGAIPEMLLQHPQYPSEFSILLEAETDATGRARMFVRLGSLAGPARLVVAAPTVAVEDTARYTVLPGNAQRVELSPRDTTLYTGRSFTLRGTVVDAAGNPRTGTVTYTGSVPGVSVGSTGVVSVSAIGRYTVTGTGGGVSGSAGISVVPQGTMAASTVPGVAQQIVVVALDGSGIRYLTSGATGSTSSQPRWIPGTDRIIYSTFTSDRQLLRIVDQSGTVTPFLASPPATMLDQADPSPSLNAPVVYFSAVDTRCSTTLYCLHRSGTDGSAPEPLGALFAPNETTWHPSSSPDGSRVAFVTGGSIIKVFDYASKTVLPWSVPGQYPSWSPDGSRIAFVPQDGGPLHLINAADGSGERVLTPASRPYDVLPISWSSDSKWLLARANAGVLDLIEVATGTVLPLAYSSEFLSASLK